MLSLTITVQHAMMIMLSNPASDKLSMDNLELLKANLSAIGREDLKKLVEEYEKEEPIRKFVASYYRTVFEYSTCMCACELHCVCVCVYSVHWCSVC